MKTISNSDADLILKAAPILKSVVYSNNTGNKERNAADALMRVARRLNNKK